MLALESKLDRYYSEFNRNVEIMKVLCVVLLGKNLI